MKLINAEKKTTNELLLNNYGFSYSRYKVSQRNKKQFEEKEVSKKPARIFC